MLNYFYREVTALDLKQKTKQIAEYYKTTAVFEAFITIKNGLKNNQLMFALVIGLIITVGIMVGPFTYKTLNFSETKKYETVNPDNSTVQTDIETVLEETIYITVSGEVKNPGMYKMTADDRINDAIIKAGGFTENAYTENVNLAQKLTDEQYINIMSIDEANSQTAPQYKETKFRGIVNINTASIEELCKLDGIGEATARKIIEYREQTGRYENIIDIQNVKGIGPAKYEKIKNNITV